MGKANRTRDALPPLRCTATALRTGQQCARFAVVGSLVCWAHGGAARQVREKAEARTTAATAAAGARRVGLSGRLSEEARMPWSVLLDGVRVVDAVACDLVDQVQAAGEHATPEMVDRMVSTVRTANAMSEASIRLGLVRIAGRLARHQLNASTAVVIGTIEAFLEHVGGSGEPEAKLWLIRAGQASLAALDGASRPLEERPGRTEESEEARRERLLVVVREAVGSVDWGLDFVLMSRGDRDELVKLRREAWERAVAAAAPAPTPVQSVTSVMTLPGSPAGYRPPGPLPALPAAAARADEVEEDDEPLGVAPDAEPLAVVGRVVDGPGTRWPFPSVFSGNGWRP